MPAKQAPRRKKRIVTSLQKRQRLRILVVARKLLATRGYDGITMRDLARMSGVAFKTLYNIYGSKDDLLIASVRDRVAQVFERSAVAAGKKSGISLLLHFVDSASAGTLATPTLSKAIAPLISGPVDKFGLREIFNRCHKRALDDIERAGDFQPWADVESVLDALLTTLRGSLLMWSKEQIETSDLPFHDRLAVCQVLMLTVRGNALRESTAVAKAAFIEIYRKRSVAG